MVVPFWAYCLGWNCQYYALGLILCFVVPHAVAFVDFPGLE